LHVSATVTNHTFATARRPLGPTAAPPPSDCRAILEPDGGHHTNEVALGATFHVKRRGGVLYLEDIAPISDDHTYEPAKFVQMVDLPLPPFCWTKLQTRIACL
jgi:hypothetical protein